jgi:GNAT superfamily N-acetyltransferase
LHDVEVVLDLLAEAAVWTAARGYPNWPTRFAVTLQWHDPYFWGDEGDDERAGYLHRMVVRRDHAGGGLGAQLLGWAEEQVQARGRSQLRLDVVTDNAPLRGYYEAVGFAHVRDVSGEWTARDGSRHNWCTSLYRRTCRQRGSAE